MHGEKGEREDGHGFVEQMEAVYRARNYDADRRYSEFHPPYLQRVQSMEAAYLSLLDAAGLSGSISQLRALDFGCGNGRWMARLMSWGLRESNLAGVDIRDAAVRAARELLPGCGIDRSEDGEIPRPDGSFDVCFVNLVFTSIIDDARRAQAATELQRVTRPGGVILVLDFRFNNPSNPNVRRVTVKALQGLMRQCTLITSRSLVLAPPLASVVAPRARWLAAALESLPFLRTHFVAGFRKTQPGGAA